MKKFSLATAVLFLALAGSAQSVQFGLKAGANVSGVKDDNAPNTDSRVGFHVGGLAHIHLAPMFAIQPEVMFSTEGADYKVTGFDGETKASYIQVPLNLQFMTKGFRIQTGPQIGFLVSSDFEPRGTDDQVVNPVTNDVNFSWTAGVGYLTKAGIGIDARYNHGITNIYEANGPMQAKSRVWQFGLFYQLGKK